MERDNRAEASHLKEQRVEAITEPLPIAPGTPSQGERKHVLAGYRVMTQDPFTGPNVHTGIGIGEQGRRASHLPIEQYQGYKERERGQRGETRRGSPGRLDARADLMFMDDCACHRIANSSFPIPDYEHPLVHPQFQQR